MYSSTITLFDWLLAPFYLLLIYIWAAWMKNRLIKKNPVYKYFIWGLFAKIGGAIGLCLIYVYYYKGGGDTLSYHHDSSVLLNLLFISPSDFLNAWLFPMTKQTAYLFTSDTGYPDYLYDSNSYMVVRLLVPIKLICFDQYVVSSIVIAAITFSGVWRLYMLFTEHYPKLSKELAVTVLFVPSVVFWGSGMLKDSWTLSAAGWYCYGFHRMFIKNDRVLFPFIALLISSAILIGIKPYIFVALLPSSLLWMVWKRITDIRNIILKIIVVPVILSLGVGMGTTVWLLASDSLGLYGSIDSIVKMAHASYDDLKQAYYRGNSFDLGDYEPTLGGMISKFPIATVTGLFRPYLWEARNIVMFFSGIENFLILLFTIWVLLRNPIFSFGYLFSNPMVLFCLVFAICFAFSVAISTSNFGALVRLRVPMMPFFLSGLMLIEYGKYMAKGPRR